jgi:SAM-dependent methyltransferase
MAAVPEVSRGRTAGPNAADGRILMSGDIGTQYGRTGLGEAIVQALRASGKDPEALLPADLAPVDHFHTRGREATLELARRAAIARGARVLDVGGGIGGAARLLATEHDCRVTVLDLTEEYCCVGADLTRRAGLEAQVEFRHGDALAMPFADGAFDAVWTQHSSMNVEDKAALYREIRRVLAPGGTLALHEIVAGARQPPHFPVPWARDVAISHLQPAAAIRDLLRGLGFRERDWEDQSASTLAWLRERQGAGAPGPLGMHLLLGTELTAMLSNLGRNLAEDRVRVVMAVWERG